MSSLRLVIVAALAVVLAAAPLFSQGLATSSGDLSVHAATAASPLVGGGAENDDGGDNGGSDDNSDNGDDDDTGDNSDNGDEDDNRDNFGDEGGDNDFDNDDDNEGSDGGAPPPPPSPAAAQVATTVSGCIGTGGSATLEFPGGTATVTNADPNAPAMNVRLERAAPAAGPQGQLDAIIFNAFFENCGGGALAEPVPNVNLGIRYTVGANKAGLRIVTLQGNQFAEAGIVTAPDPDPNNAYISATIPARTAAYSVVQR